MNSPPLDRVIEILGLTGLARALGGISVPGVAKWRRNGVPLDRCPQIEAAVAGAIRCEDLRPDVEWTRDATGAVTGYHVRVSPPTEPAADAAAKVA